MCAPDSTASGGISHRLVHSAVGLECLLAGGLAEVVGIGQLVGVEADYVQTQVGQGGTVAANDSNGRQFERLAEIEASLTSARVNSRTSAPRLRSCTSRPLELGERGTHGVPPGRVALRKFRLPYGGSGGEAGIA